MSSIDDYKYPEEHKFEGVNYHYGHTQEVLGKIKEELQLDASDVVIATYPKSGTTWMQELLYSIMNGPRASATRTDAIDEIFLFIEMLRFREAVPRSNYSLIPSTPSPRLLKTHLNASFYERHLEGQATCPKFIVVSRNPKDALASFYRFHCMLRPFEFDFSWDEFFEKFKKKSLLYGDIFNFYTGWWKYRNHPNVMFFTYEDMLADTDQIIRQVADFVEHPIPEAQVEEVRESASFEKMKGRGLNSYHESEYFDQSRFQFFGQGRCGNWKDYFSTEQSDYVDERVRKECEPLGLSFTYE